MLCYGERLLDVAVKFNDMNFYLSCVYGDPILQYRHFLWERLERIGTTRHDPWILMGDFNEILSNDEKKGGRKRDEWTFMGLRNLYNTCDLSDLKAQGDRFSWSGKRYKHTVLCCLDRVAVNSAWLTKYPASEAAFLRFYGSDHRPVITNILTTPASKRKRQFRFDKRLLDCDDFKNYVHHGWNVGNNTDQNIGTRIRSCQRAMWQCKYNSRYESEFQKHTWQ